LHSWLSVPQHESSLPNYRCLNMRGVACTICFLPQDLHNRQLYRVLLIEPVPAFYPLVLFNANTIDIQWSVSYRELPPVNDDVALCSKFLRPVTFDLVGVVALRTWQRSRHLCVSKLPLSRHHSTFMLLHLVMISSVSNL
jgi:hypothetical protein